MFCKMNLAQFEAWLHGMLVAEFQDRPSWSCRSYPEHRHDHIDLRYYGPQGELHIWVREMGPEKILVELDDYERDTLYPLATRQVALDLDDGVKVNYIQLGAALKKIPGLDAPDD